MGDNVYKSCDICECLMGAAHMISGGGRISEQIYPTNRIGTTTTKKQLDVC